MPSSSLGARLAGAALLLSCAAFGGADAVFVSMSPGGVDGIYLPEERPELALVATNATGTALDIDLDCALTDYFGNTVRTARASMSVASGGGTAHTFAWPEVSRPGFYCATVRWRGGAFSGTAEGTFVKVGPMPAVPDPLFGMSSFGDNNAERYARMGVGTKKIILNWRSLEGRDGKIGLGKILPEIRALRARGIAVEGSLGGLLRANAIPKRFLKKSFGKKDDPVKDPAAFLAAYEDFVFRLVSELKGDIHVWAAGGEINLLAHIAPYARQRYVETVHAISRGLRRADPSATLLGLACSGADGRAKPRYTFLQGLLPEVVDAIDGFGIDQYTAGQTYGPGYENLNSEQTELREMILEAMRIAKANGKKHVTIGEKGPSIARSTPLSSQLGRRAADIVAREFIILKTIPGFGTWLYFRPFNWNPKSVIDYGMWEKANPRQVVSAYSATARALAGSQFVKGFNIHSDIPCWMFRKGGRFFGTLWYNGQAPLDFRMPPDSPVEAVDMQGNPQPVEAGVLRLSSSPVYVFAETLEALEKALGSAAFDVPDVDAVTETTATGGVLLAVRNIGSRPLTATVAGGAAEPVALAPGETKTSLIKSPSGPLTVKTSTGRTVAVAVPDAPMRVRRASGFSDLPAEPTVLLDDPMRYALGYADLKANGLYTGTNDLSVALRMGYDDSNIYLQFDVRDDVHVNDNLPARVFAGDCVQFAFDTMKDGRIKKLEGVRGFSDDDYNIVSGLADGKCVTWCYTAAAPNRARMHGKRIADPEIVRDEASKTTRYRIVLPFADLAPLSSAKGTLFGFSFVVFDKDPVETKRYSIAFTRGVSGSPSPALYPAFILD